MSGKFALYAAVGPDFVHYDADVESGTLTHRDTLHTPYPYLKFAWADPARKFLYAASTNAPMSAPGDDFNLSAYRIDPSSGALSAHGAAKPLPASATHLTLDAQGRHALAVFRKGMITVNRIAADGTLGDAVKQPEGLNGGVFSHQIRVAPSNDLAIVVARGNRATRNKPEEPGVLNVFNYRDGVLSEKARVAPGGGYGFGPRNLDFHPTRPWVYVCLELQSRIHVYKLEQGGLSAQPAFVKDTLGKPGWVAPHQIAGQIHVHPSGRFVYIANRAAGTVDFEGRPFFAGGANDMAVFSINQETGEPTLIQNEDTRGIYPFSSCIDPTGRMLVVGNAEAFEVRDTAGTTTRIPACLSTFRIGDDGKLTFVAKYDVEPKGEEMLIWTGLYRIG